MMRFVVCVICIFAAFASADLPHEIEAALNNKLLSRARSGICVVRLGDSFATSPVIYTHEPRLPLIPASNLKVVTTSATLDFLGPDFKFRTLLIRHADDLVLLGDGDPSFGDSDYLKKVGWDSTTVFRNWADELKKKGITKIANVLVDDGVFEIASLHPNWPRRDLMKKFSAEVGGLNLNANCVDFSFQAASPGEAATYRANPDTAYLNVTNEVTSGDNSVIAQREPDSNELLLKGTAETGSLVSIPVHDPSMFTGTVLAETLRSSGIEIGGTVKRDRTIRASLERAATAPSTQPAWSLIAVNETPLLQVMSRANKDSVNLYAEAMGKRLGFAVSHQSGSWANGTAAVGSFLQKVGVPPDEFHLDDGCGLSHENHVTANAMARVLVYDYFSKNRDAYMNTLSVAGSDGTLKDRFPDRPDLRGRVIGKSGFVEGVSSISGYLHAKDGHYYVFSILMNGIPHQSNSMIKPIQEAIIAAVDKSAAKLTK